MLEKIKIGGMEYQVKEVKFGESNDNITFGECHFEKAEILISENLSDSRKEQTLFHEMVHAMLFESGSDEYDNEELVNQLGLIMYQVFKDNFNNYEEIIEIKPEKFGIKKMLGLHNPNDVFKDEKINPFRNTF